jgi:hypothetical protein
VKNKKKPSGVKHEIREEKKRQQRIGLAVTVAILIIIIFVSGFLINSMLNQPSTNQTSQLKAVIVDQLSLTMPNQTFIQKATNTLKQAGYTVDYYPGEKVTVEFYRNLPTYAYKLIILRVHSAAAAYQEGEYVEASVCFFTSEPYSKTKHVPEQLTDQLVIVSYTMPQPPYYFGILPKFVTSSNGEFRNSTIIMMGCEGLNNTSMAEVFVEKGAKAYIGWNGMVSASQTDQATTQLLQHFLIEKLTLKQSVQETFKEVGFDPPYKSLLIYYPLKVGDQTIEDIACES